MGRGMTSERYPVGSTGEIFLEMMRSGALLADMPAAAARLVDDRSDSCPPLGPPTKETV